MDAFTAYAIAPFAYLSPSGEAEITEPVSFGANLGGGEHSGELFGKMANIRFVAIGTKWSFSDGQRLSGQFVTTSFELPELVTASAEVSYRIDYRYPGESWVLNAATASLTSNQLSLSVVDPPRRTLLIA